MPGSVDARRRVGNRLRPKCDPVVKLWTPELHDVASLASMVNNDHTDTHAHIFTRNATPLRVLWNPVATCYLNHTSTGTYPAGLSLYSP